MSWYLGMICLAAIVACSKAPKATTSGPGGAGAGATGQGGAGGSSTPDAPGDLALAVQAAPHGVALSWTAPSSNNVADYLIVRSTGSPPSAPPEDGTWYAARDTFGDARVIAVSTTPDAFDATPQLEADNHYAVYARDGEARYSPPATGTIQVPFPPQTATLTVHDPTGTPSVEIDQPSYVKLAASATYDATTSEVRMDVAMNNQAHRVLFNPKLVIDSSSEGSASGNGRNPAGMPLVHFGSRGLAVDGWASRSLSVSGVTADPLVLEVTVKAHPLIIVAPPFDYGFPSHAFFVDSSGASDLTGRVFQSAGSYPALTYNQYGGLKSAVVSPDGRYLYAGTRNLPYVARIDLVDRELVLGDSLASVDGRGFVGSVACASDGSFLLASLVNARHRHAGTNSLSEDWANAPPATVELVKLALPGLAEVGRVTLNNGQPPDISLFPLAEREWGQGTARVLPAALALSPDDQLAAIPNPWGQGVWLVDVASMAIVDADSTTAGDQPVDLSANAEAPRAAIFSVDGATLYVAHHHDDSTVSVIDVATKQVSTIATGSTGATRWTGWTFTTPEELLLTRRQGGLLALDLAAQTATMIVASADLSGVVLDPNGQRAYLVHTVSNQIDVIDAASHAPIDSDGDTANGITPLLIDDSGFNYAQLSGTYSVAITPF